MSIETRPTVKIMLQVLVLNQDYQAISLIDVRRAFVLVLLDKAERVATRPDAVIRTVKKEFEFPSIIRLRRYVRVPFRKIALSRHNVFRRDGNACGYCGSKQNLTLDHIVPRSQGGRHTWTNLVTACQSCNSRKGNRTPEEAGMPLQVKAYRPNLLMFMGQDANQVDEAWKPYLFLS